MPLYEYQCDACGHRFEAIRKFSDPPLETCPNCGGHVHKLISAPAFQFKGSGWYVTDYGKKDSSPASKTGESKKEESKESKESKDSTKDSTPAKSDAPAAKSDTAAAPAPAKKAD